MANTSYSCSQATLYNVCRLVWQMIGNKLAEFAGYNTIYILPYIAENLALIKAAERLPDAEQRREEVDTLSLSYDKMGARVVLLGKYLLTYIDEAYPKEMRSIMYKAAGYDSFDKVKAFNSNAIPSWFSDALLFVEQKAETLSKGGMPKDFLEKLKAADKEFEEILKQYNAAVATAKERREEKILANNDIYARAQKALLHGRNMNLEMPEQAKLYQFSAVLAQVEDGKNAGISGKITEEGGKKGIAGIAVTEPISGKTAVTDKDGRYEITPLSMDKYTLIFSGEGYETQTIEKIAVKTGVTTRQNAAMKPAAKV